MGIANKEGRAPIEKLGEREEESTISHRVRGVQDREAGIATRLMFWRITRWLGHVPLTDRILAFEPKLLRLFLRMNKYTASSGALSGMLKELVQLKVAAMVGCPF